MNKDISHESWIELLNWLSIYLEYIKNAIDDGDWRGTQFDQKKTSSTLVIQEKILVMKLRNTIDINQIDEDSIFSDVMYMKDKNPDLPVSQTFLVYERWR